LVPEISPVMPADPEGYVQPDPYSAKIYSQEVSRGYTDGHGNIVMLLVAYGPVQNYRLKAHRPEFCYTAAGFRVSDKAGATLSYREGVAPIKMTRLIAEREARYEPISYWMRVGNDVSNGVVDRQLIRIKYGLRGIIPDGALVRISTINLPREASFRLQDQFIRDLLAAVPPSELKFFTGES
jgi:EpsI family protein